MDRPHWGDSLPEAEWLRYFACGSLVISLVQLVVGSVVYDEVDTFQLGAWWAALVSIIADIIAIVSSKRIATYAVCIISTIALIVNIAAAVVDNFAVVRVQSLHACVGSDGQDYYGHSYAFSSAAACFEKYSFQHYDCYCVTNYNTSIPDSNSDLSGITCVNLEGSLFNSRSSSQGCSIVFTGWIPNLRAAAYFDAFGTILMFFVCVFSSVLLCCPSCLRIFRRCSIRNSEKFENMIIK